MVKERALFNKILIANRGEIACRITETAHRLGVSVVAVYSDADARAKHVAMADEAVHIGGAKPSESYLCAERIIAAALQTGAQAIHPGYGFLSENPEFVEAVEAAGLVFIGPTAAAIRAMGLKDAAKKVMEAAGVPVVPGYHGGDQSDARLAQAASEIGYPVLIKAVAGGGGKGMRLVEGPSGFADALTSARSEAQSAFGNADVLVEKYITAPRHIEVQVFGDGTQAVHLFERDCSLQRRHQKVIEEAPAPGMTQEVRDAMGSAAVRAAEAIGYTGAGTIEFIVDGSNGLRADGFWFMEMNTRLQVEHPVTEAITGVDLVEWQLRVASGEPLPARQDELSINGHAFEARLYAEDVPAGFLPATGRLLHLQFDDQARNDSGVRAGDEISPYYDPMIAKIITHGPTRASALTQLQRALGRTQVAGVVTNVGFNAMLAAWPDFVAGNVDTGLIGRNIDALSAQSVDITSILVSAAVAKSRPEVRTSVSGFSLWHRYAQTLDMRIAQEGSEAKGVSVHWAADGAIVTVDGRDIVVSKDQGALRSTQCHIYPAHVDGDNITVFSVPPTKVVHIDPLDQQSTTVGQADDVLAPMPGSIRSVNVAVGDAVSQGDRLVVLEAMKMEHSLTAPRDGVVAGIHAAVGDQVQLGACLIQLEPDVTDA